MKKMIIIQNGGTLTSYLYPVGQQIVRDLDYIDLKSIQSRTSYCGKYSIDFKLSGKFATYILPLADQYTNIL